MDEKNNKNHSIEFLIGIVLLCSGLFILAQKVTVSSGWHTFYVGAFSISSGLVTIPLILCFIWYIVKPNKASKLCLIISAILLVLSIIINTKFYFSYATLFDYIVIFGLISLGIGLILKENFRK